jgi:hypothetical protein
MLKSGVSKRWLILRQTKKKSGSASRYLIFSWFVLYIQTAIPIVLIGGGTETHKAG